MVDSMPNAQKGCSTKDKMDANVEHMNNEKVKRKKAREIRIAEEKKEATRNIIKVLQEKFRENMQRNKSLPPCMRLTEEELDVDPEYTNIQKAKRERAKIEVEQKYAEELENSDQMRKKLQSVYIDSLITEDIIVTGIQNMVQVQTLPGLELPSFIVKIIRSSMNNIDPKGELESSEGLSSLFVKKNQDLSDNSLDALAHEEKGEESETKYSTYEIRKAMRKRRKKDMELMISRQPDENADDPTDVSAIFNAEANLGCYNLKMSNEYKVPDDIILNASKSIREIALLEQSLHSIKTKFNEKVIKLRKTKIDIIEQILAGNKKIAAIDALISSNAHDKSLSLQDCNTLENYETHFIVPDTDYIMFHNPIKENEQCFQSMSVPKLNNDNETNLNVHSSIEIEDLLDSPEFPIQSSFDSLISTSKTLSHVENEELEELIIILQDKKRALLRENKKMVQSFNQSLYLLCKERFRLSYQIKSGELRLMVMMEELTLLRGFEEKESKLSQRLEICQRDKREILSQIQDHSIRMDAKKKELNECMLKYKTLLNDFSSQVPDYLPYSSELKKIFLKRMKRNDSDSFNSDSDDSESEYSFEEDSDSEDETADSCPSGCETQFFDHILALREERVEQESKLNTFRKELEALKRINDRYITRHGQIEKDLSASKMDLQRFHGEKQKRVNELNTIVAIKAEQIFLHDNVATNEMDDRAKTEKSQVNSNRTKCNPFVDNSNMVVFPKLEFGKVQGRIGELQCEIMHDKDSFKTLQREKGRLEKVIDGKNEAINKREKMCDELQHLKFGQLINIEALDQMSFNTEKSDYDDENKKMIVTQSKQMQSILKQQNELREDLYSRTQHNTQLLKEIGKNNEKLIKLERKSNKMEKLKGPSENNSECKHNIEISEKKELKLLFEMVNNQTRVLKALRDEIPMLQKKGGCIITPCLVFHE